MNLSLVIAIGAGALLACAWLGRRWPSVLLAIVLASFAVGPEWVLARHLPDRLLLLAIPAQELLLVAALAANAVRYGLRAEILVWPLLGVGLLLVQSALLADLDPRLSVARIAIAALGLALPWSLAAVVLEPGTRARYALLIALLPSLCVAIGVALQAAGLYAAVLGSGHRVARLQGASNAGWLVCLALAGFAIALHEAIRARQAALAGLAGVNLAIGLMTGGRMGVVAGALFTLAYGVLDERVRARLSRARRPLIGIGAAAAVLLLGWLILQSYGEIAAGLPMSGRNAIWARHFERFRESPIFGHGVGAAALVSSYFELPHNVYLRLLVEGGAAGLLLYGGALLLWTRQLLARVDPDERGFAQALLLALAVYGLTDNLLTMPSALVPFLYLGLMVGEPCRAPAGAAPALRDAPPATAAPGSLRQRSAPGSSSGR